MKHEDRNKQEKKAANNRISKWKIKYQGRDLISRNSPKNICKNQGTFFN